MRKAYKKQEPLLIKICKHFILEEEALSYNPKISLESSINKRNEFSKINKSYNTIKINDISSNQNSLYNSKNQLVWDTEKIMCE